MSPRSLVWPEVFHRLTTIFIIVLLLLLVLATRVTVSASDEIASSSSSSSSSSIFPVRDGLEFCETEKFEPECADDEVIMIKEAKYGRMRLGRCVQVDYGYIGCYADVTEHLDALCSGRRSCRLGIPDSSLDEAKSTSKCPREFKTYLNVSYRCLEVESDGCQSCVRSAHGGFARTSRPNAFIGSIVSAESRVQCGGSKCPWNVEVPSGQTINITLLDFAMEQRNNGGGDHSFHSHSSYSSPDKCCRYAVIKEKPYSRDTPVCGGHGRRRLVYSSVSNSVEVHVVSAEVFSRLGQFVLHYEAVGCPDVPPPDNAALKRMGDRVEIHCRGGSNQKWQRNCVGTQWQGEMGTCPVPLDGSSPNPEGGILSVGLLTAIVIGIALVIAVCIVTVGLVYIKRQHRGQEPRPESTLYVRPGQCVYELRESMPNQPLNETGTLSIRKPTSKGGVAGGAGGETAPAAGQVVRLAVGRRNLYDAPRLMESRPLPSIPNPTTGEGGVMTPLHPGGPVEVCPATGEQFTPHRGPLIMTQRTAVLGSAAKMLVQGVDGGGVWVKTDSSQGIPLLPCAVGAEGGGGGIGAGMNPPHYTDLDPNEVRQLMTASSPVVSFPHQQPLLLHDWSGSSGTACIRGDQTAGTSACSYPSSTPSHTDDGGSGSTTSGEEGRLLNGGGGGSSSEIPLRPMREGSQQKIDSTATAGVAPWSSGADQKGGDTAANNSGNSSWP